ncbi:hypothetical protein EJ110_NYTH11284 [Nymphaea thermarum]|nr:hypothetical protein EJ110_NYTH11284 [Nymphaea thermarum]
MQWYHWWIDLNSQANWDQFKAELLLRFGNTSFVNYEVELRNLKQLCSVQEYQSHFERLSCMVRNRPEEALIGHFIGGLVEDIQIDMLAQPPVELRDYDSDDDEEPSTPNDDTEEDVGSKSDPEKLEEIGGLCHTLTNLHGPNSMRILGRIGKHKVMVLLDTRHRYVPRDVRHRHEEIVEWEGPDGGTSWEELDRIRLWFPHSRAWGQARSKEGGVDTVQPSARSTRTNGDGGNGLNQSEAMLSLAGAVSNPSETNFQASRSVSDGEGVRKLSEVNHLIEVDRVEDLGSSHLEASASASAGEVDSA